MGSARTVAAAQERALKSGFFRGAVTQVVEAAVRRTSALASGPEGYSSSVEGAATGSDTGSEAGSATGSATGSEYSASPPS